ncbi:unnamed protein product [Anisakis simplex]|uniref:Coiled-coil domain-containing protein 106-like n=1 Tax=Anisakis simplex TaxID=6269 RepID=A0A0M3K1N0_ANISI|nr:unnamed protein product [Anisakis simplex]
MSATSDKNISNSETHSVANKENILKLLSPPIADELSSISISGVDDNYTENASTTPVSSQPPRLDLSSGFIRHIVYNQVARVFAVVLINFVMYKYEIFLTEIQHSRDEYDKLLKAKSNMSTDNGKKSRNDRTRQLYVPPHKRQQVAATALENADSVKNPWMRIAEQDSPERLAIRKRLEREMESKKKMKVGDTFVSKALFVVHYSDINGKNLEQVVRSDDAPDGLASVISRRMGLSVDECHELSACLQSEIDKTGRRARLSHRLDQNGNNGSAEAAAELVISSNESAILTKSNLSNGAVLLPRRRRTISVLAVARLFSFFLLKQLFSSFF